MTPGRGSFRNSVLLVIATVYGIIKEKEAYIMETKEVLVLLRNAHGLTQDEAGGKAVCNAAGGLTLGDR